MTGRAKNTASTLSLSVLVTIEMFNALNAISEDGSLLQVPPWVNPWLLLAMAVSFGLHFVILYIPVLAQIFSITPLTVNDWVRDAAEMQPSCGRDAAEVQPRCSRGAAEVQPRCSRGATGVPASLVAGAASSSVSRTSPRRTRRHCTF